MKERDHAFDLLCGICIVRMVCLHIMNMCGLGQTPWWRTVMAWSFFFMCFFFFKAGYFNKGVQGPTLPYLRTKAQRLLIPYLTTGWIGLVVYFGFLPFLLDRYHKPIEPLRWAHIWESGSFYGNQPTWFLLSFFMAYVLAHLLEKVRWLRWLVLAFPVLSYWFFLHDNPLWLGMDNVFMGVFFFYLGRVWHVLMGRFSRQTMMGVSVVLLVCFAVCNVMWHGEYTMAYNQFRGQFPFIILNTTLALCGLAGLLLTLRLPRIPVLCFTGQHSMVYFVSHYPMLYFYKFTHLCFGRSIYGRADDAIILVPVIFCLCTWLVPYVERVPWFSGRWKADK